MKKVINLKIEMEFKDPKNLDLVFAAIEAETNALFESIVGSAALVKQGVVMNDQEISVLDYDLLNIQLLEIEDNDTKTVW